MTAGNNEAAEMIVEAMAEALTSKSVTNPLGHEANVVDALSDVARALVLLGNADASTPMGALEAHGKAIDDASEKIAAGLHDIADAIRDLSGGR